MWGSRVQDGDEQGNARDERTPSQVIREEEDEAGHGRQLPRYRGVGEELEALDLTAATPKRPSHIVISSMRSWLKDGAGGHCIDTPLANCFFAGIIILNAIFIGVETDSRTSQLNEKEEEWFAWFVAESFFLVIFLTELVLRFHASGCRAGVNDRWNQFDMALLTLGILESWVIQTGFEGEGHSGRVFSLLRLVRLLRVLRIVRLVRYFKELQLLARGFLEALYAMFWAFIFINLVLYISSVLMTNILRSNTTTQVASQDVFASITILSTTVVDPMNVSFIYDGTASVTVTATTTMTSGFEGGNASWNAVIASTTLPASGDDGPFPLCTKCWFGSVGASYFTLFQLMTLTDWPYIVRHVMDKDQWTWVFFVPFMLFMNFVMVNVITALVVEKVFTIAKTEATKEAKQLERVRIGTLRKIRTLFSSIDVDSDEALTLDEFREALNSPSVVQQFLELGIAKYEADDFFECLDLDGNKELSVTEFVEGCLRVHGVAQSKHLLQVQYDIFRARDSFRADFEVLNEYMRSIIRYLSFRSTRGDARSRHEDESPTHSVTSGSPAHTGVPRAPVLVMMPRVPLDPPPPLVTAPPFTATVATVVNSTIVEAGDDAQQVPSTDPAGVIGSLSSDSEACASVRVWGQHTSGSPKNAMCVDVAETSVTATGALQRVRSEQIFITQTLEDLITEVRRLQGQIRACGLARTSSVPSAGLDRRVSSDRLSAEPPSSRHERGGTHQLPRPCLKDGGAPRATPRSLYHRRVSLEW